ncbi:trehalase [Anarrhichthys ocellatus]|uniref:trehalase n=1 Tax=Anarrhichthys ocellatus TaxID=433405 RepID=UPI0012EE0462|nr:trehalase [Anarrhichthys ocellatus]
MHMLVVFSVSSVALFACVNGAFPPPCDSEIYCAGPILHQVQKAKLFDDKYFVDMKLREAPGKCCSSAFRNLSNESPNITVPPAKLEEFLRAYFEKPGTEFESWTPPDWHNKPKFLGGIADQELRNWAEKIHFLWKSLGRKVMSDVKDHPELYSQIYTPHPAVVPGGRFRELYYWDSYWVINGLLLSEMTDTAHRMIQNFLYLVNRYGFIPNGGRNYYERCSQPPFLTLMVESYYQATKDKEFLRAALPALEQEYRFWMHNRSVTVKVNGTEHLLNRYHVQVGLPRPESYTDDLELAEGLTEVGKEQLWIDLKAGAEFGWDFTFRWYMYGTGSLGKTSTSQVLPTDLNVLLCLNERTLASFHWVSDGDSAALYDHNAVRRLEAIESVLWDAERGAWFDFNLMTHSKNFEFYPSNLAPVWARCYSPAEMGEKAVEYLKESGALQFPNGVPTSLRESGQQWDYPNAWPPLQHMLIDGLSKLPPENAKQLAFDLAQRWIKTNWLAYMKYDAMFEKYDVNGDGKPGCGGEYEVRLGFGWTNDVALQLLDQCGATPTSGSRRMSSGLLLPLVISVALMLQ